MFSCHVHIMTINIWIRLKYFFAKNGFLPYLDMVALIFYDTHALKYNKFQYNHLHSIFILSLKFSNLSNVNARKFTTSCSIYFLDVVSVNDKRVKWFLHQLYYFELYFRFWAKKSNEIDPSECLITIIKDVNFKMPQLKFVTPLNVNNESSFMTPMKILENQPTTTSEIIVHVAIV